MLREPEPPIRRATANVLTPSGNAHAHGIGLTAGAELVRACTLHLQLRPRRRAAKGLDRLEILEVRCWPRTNRQRKAVYRDFPFGQLSFLTRSEAGARQGCLTTDRLRIYRRP